jgi:hypothetical protein
VGSAALQLLEFVFRRLRVAEEAHESSSFNPLLDAETTFVGEGYVPRVWLADDGCRADGGGGGGGQRGGRGGGREKGQGGGRQKGEKGEGGVRVDVCECLEVLREVVENRNGCVRHSHMLGALKTLWIIATAVPARILASSPHFQLAIPPPPAAQDAQTAECPIRRSLLAIVEGLISNDDPALAAVAVRALAACAAARFTHHSISPPPPSRVRANDPQSLTDSHARVQVEEHAGGVFGLAYTAGGGLGGGGGEVPGH